MKSEPISTPESVEALYAFSGLNFGVPTEFLLFTQQAWDQIPEARRPSSLVDPLTGGHLVVRQAELERQHAAGPIVDPALA